MKETLEEIRTICGDVPVIGEGSSFSDACECSMALNEINDIAIKACMDQQKNAPDVATHAAPVERDGDGDTLEEMKAVWDKFGKGSVDLYYYGGTDGWRRLDRWSECTAGKLRITAKHADTFDPECMDFETWARAAIGRGMICRGEGRLRIHNEEGCRHEDCIILADIIIKNELIGPDNRGSKAHPWPLNYGPKNWTWTAIPPAAPDASEADDARDSCDYKHACTTKHCLGVSAPCYDGPVKQADDTLTEPEWVQQALDYFERTGQTPGEWLRKALMGEKPEQATLDLQACLMDISCEIEAAAANQNKTKSPGQAMVVMAQIIRKNLKALQAGIAGKNK